MPTKFEKKSPREITDLLARNAKTASGQSRTNIKDSVVQGFTLRVTSSGAKSFALMMRDSTGQNRTFTIGTYPEVSVKDARSIAERMRHQVRYEGMINVTRTGKEVPSPITLRELLDEVQPIFAKMMKGWRPRGGPKSKANMKSTIETVFASLLDRPVEGITELELAKCANSYKPLRPLKGKQDANGQVSRAMSYLAPVLDWAAHRGKFIKIGKGRNGILQAPAMRAVHDPSIDDPTITRKRERVLSVQELAAVLPLLTYPAHPKLRRRNMLPKNDYGPIAMKFFFLTLARRSEVATARWKDFDFINGVWNKPDTKTKKGETIRAQSLPLSTAALDLLKSLPGYGKAKPTDYVFPNRDGGLQDNWQRISDVVQKASGTSDWTRHDARRTASTILEELGVALQTIDAILNHTNRLANANVSGSAGHYLIATRILNATEDPKATALNKLAAVYDVIIEKVASSAAA